MFGLEADKATICDENAKIKPNDWGDEGDEACPGIKMADLLIFQTNLHTGSSLAGSIRQPPPPSILYFGKKNYDIIHL